MNLKTDLYSKLGQITDYLLPLVVLLIASRSEAPLIVKIILSALSLLFLLLSFRSYRLSVDAQHIYLNNLFAQRTISRNDIVRIERTPFYYSSSGGITSTSYRLIYQQGEALKSAIIVIGKAGKYREAWQSLTNVTKRKRDQRSRFSGI